MTATRVQNIESPRPARCSCQNGRCDFLSGTGDFCFDLGRSTVSTSALDSGRISTAEAVAMEISEGTQSPRCASTSELVSLSLVTWSLRGRRRTSNSSSFTMSHQEHQGGPSSTDESQGTNSRRAREESNLDQMVEELVDEVRSSSYRASQLILTCPRR